MEESLIKKKCTRASVFLIFASLFLYVAVTSATGLYTAEKTTLYTLGKFGNLTNLATTLELYYYTYAAMQIFLIFFIRKVNIKWFLTLTLASSAVLIASVSVTNGINQHYLIYAVNGVFQAGTWGCLLKMLSVHIPSRLLPLANQVISAGPALSGGASYTVAAAFGENWKTSFLFMGLFLFFATLLYFVSVTRIERLPKEAEALPLSDTGTVDECGNDFINLKNKKRIVVFYAVSMLMGFLFTSLYFMVKNNLDVFLKEIGGFTNSTSKLLAIFAPIFAAIGPFLAVRSCEKRKNFITVAALYFGAALIFATLLVFLFASHVALSLSLAVLFMVFVNGGWSVTLSIASLRMRGRIDTGIYSSLVNSVSSVASGIAPKFITAFLDDTSYTTRDSWQASFLSVFLLNLAVVAILLSLILVVRLLNKKDREALVQ